MSSTAPDLAASLKTEFDHMLNQDYPYVDADTKTCVIVNVINNGISDVTVYPTTELRFDDGQGYTYPEVFYPYITSPVVIAASTGLTPAGSAEFLFQTAYTGQIIIQDTDNAKLFNNNTEILDLAINRTPVIDAGDECLYYFVYRMTELFAESINDAAIYDPDSGDSSGAGNLHVNFAMIKDALDYGWTNILGMQEHPSTSNGPIINTIDTYLDKLTGNFFRGALHYSYHPVRTMASDACSALDSMNLNTTQDAANTMSAEMMADVLDWYCNGELS